MKTQFDEEMISYSHKSDPEGQRFCQYKRDKLPSWAVDAQPYEEIAHDKEKQEC